MVAKGGIEILTAPVLQKTQCWPVDRCLTAGCWLLLTFDHRRDIACHHCPMHGHASPTSKGDGVVMVHFGLTTPFAPGLVPRPTTRRVRNPLSGLSSLHLENRRPLRYAPLMMELPNLAVSALMARVMTLVVVNPSAAPSTALTLRHDSPGAVLVLGGGPANGLPASQHIAPRQHCRSHSRPMLSKQLRS